MRQDVKMGIVVGGLLLVGTLIWFATRADSTPTPQPGGDTSIGLKLNEEVDQADPLDGGPEGAEADTEAEAGGLGPVGPTGFETETVTPRIRGVTGDDRRADPGAGPGIDPGPGPEAAGGAGPIGTESDEDVRGTARLPGGLGSDASYTDTGPGLDAGTSDPPSGGGSGTGPPSGGEGRPVGVASGRTPPTQPATTYTVVDGDRGFWGIAVKVYGKGKYGTLIARANPGVESTMLRPGQKLKIPSLPTKPSAEEIRRRKLAEAPPDSTTYTVQAGDSGGYWGIAEKLYGDGRFWPIIANANKDIDPNLLRAGQILVIPPKKDSATRPSTEGTRPASEIDEAGRRIYTVLSGDKGFWDVAKKMYNKGSLYPAIAQANPDVDPTQLQPGQKLVVPSLEEAERIVGSSEPETPSGPIEDEPEGLPVYD